MTSDLAARVARAADHEHDPRLLWPGLDRRAFDEAIDDIISAAQRVLRGEQSVPLAPRADAATYGRAAFRLGAGPLLGHWIQTGAIAAPAAVARVWAVHLEHGRRRHGRLTAELGRVVRALREAGVAAGVMKGLDSARFYPEPGARAFQDLDLFVRAADAPRANEVLQRLGFVAGPLAVGRRQEWNLPDQRLHSIDLTHADNPWSVDLHWSLGRIYHRALRGELPDSDPRISPRVVLGEESVPVLPPELRLAFLALHASGSIRTLLLSHLTDLVFAARATAPRTWAAMVELLAKAGSTRFAYPPLALARRLAPDAVPTEVLELMSARITPRLVRITAGLPLTGLAPPDRWRVRYAMMWAETPREAWQVLRQALQPGRFRTLREHVSLLRRGLPGLVRGALR